MNCDEPHIRISTVVNCTSQVLRVVRGFNDVEVAFWAPKRRKEPYDTLETKRCERDVSKKEMIADRRRQRDEAGAA